MNTLHAIHLDQDLQLIRNTIPGVQRSILSRLVRDVQELVHLLLIDTDFTSDLSETLVCLVAGFVDDVDVVEGFGVIEKCLCTHLHDHTF